MTSLTDLIWILPALAFSLGGIGLLYRSWNGRRSTHARPVWLGWLTLLTGTLCWLPVFLPAYGLALSLLSIELIAIAFILLRSQVLAPRPPVPAARRDAAPGPSRAWRNGLRGFAVTLLAGPLAMALSVTLSILLFALAGALGWSEADRLALFLFCVPLAWAGLASLATIDLRLRVRTLGLVVPLALSAALIALLF